MSVWLPIHDGVIGSFGRSFGLQTAMTSSSIRSVDSNPCSKAASDSNISFAIGSPGQLVRDIKPNVDIRCSSEKMSSRAISQFATNT
jgi:hypothetical protein